MKVFKLIIYIFLFYSKYSYAENYECINYLASKNIAVEESIGQWDNGLQATVEPTNKIRRVIGALVELNKQVGVIQGCNLNPNTFRCTPNSTGAIFKTNKNTKWFINMQSFSLGSHVMVYGKYNQNYLQTFTNPFGRVERVSVPVVEALCITLPEL